MEFVSWGLNYLANLELNLSGTVARLLLALLAGFPFAVLHRALLRTELQRHLASIVCGLGLLYWVFGESAIHPLVSFTFTYVVVALVRPLCSDTRRRGRCRGRCSGSGSSANRTARSPARSLDH